MSEERASISALERVVAEERSLAAPERDWDALEQRLLTRVAQAAPVARPARSRLPILAAAAALLLGVGSVSLLQRQAPPEQAAGASHTTTVAGPVAGHRLAPGSALEAHTQPVEVDYPGQARWTLAPGGKAHVTRTGSLIVLSLEQGSVDVEVVPQAASESFVVEAGSLRVAVHGTKFRVERSETVRVSVREGVVAVSKQGASSSVKLVAPASGTFAFDGSAQALSAGPGGRIEPSGGSASHPSTAGHSRAAPPSAKPTELPLEPSIGDVELGVARVSEVAQSCFERHTSAQPGVQVSVRTALRFDLHASGSIRSPSFDPPLAPAVAECTRSAMASLTLAQSQRGISVSRVLELKR